MAALTTLAAVAVGANAVNSVVQGNKQNKIAKESAAKAEATQKEILENTRSPQEIIDDLFGPDGIFSEDRLKNIADTDQRVTDVLTDLQKAYGRDVVYGEGGILEAVEQGTERTLERIKELGPEFREALEDPRLAGLVEGQIDRYIERSESSQARSAEREEAAAEFEAKTITAIEGVESDLSDFREARVDSAQPFLDEISGISGGSVRGIDTSGLGGTGVRGVDISGVGDVDISGVGGVDISGVGAVDTSRVGDVDISGVGAVDTSGLGGSGVRGIDTSGLGGASVFGVDTSGLGGAAVRGVDTSGLGGAAVRGVDFTGVSDFDTSSLRDFDLSNLTNLTFEDIKNLNLDQSTGFLGDIRGLTDTQVSEANRLTQEARGPLGFEASRIGAQAARLEGGAIGRQRDASAVARAALSRQDQVIAREDRASAARLQAAEMAGLGAKLGLSQETLRADAAQVAAKLGLSKEELVSKLGLSAEQAAMGFDFNAQEVAAKLGLSQADLASRLDITAANTQISQADLASGLDVSAAQTEINKRNLAAGLDISAAQTQIDQGNLAAGLDIAAAQTQIEQADLATKLGLTQADLAAKLGLSQAEIAATLGLTQAEISAKLGLSQAEIAAKLGLTAEELASKLDISAADLGISQEKIATDLDLTSAGMGAETAMSMDKLNLDKTNLAASLGIDIAKLNSILAAGARDEGINFRDEERQDFATTFDAAQGVSVDPSNIFLAENALATGSYVDIMKEDPDLISTDLGGMINLGIDEDAREAGIAGGLAEIYATRGLGASGRASDYYTSATDTFSNLYGTIKKTP